MPERLEMLDGTFPVVENPHRQDGIKKSQVGRYDRVLSRENVVANIPKKGPQSGKLHNVEQVRVETYHAPRTSTDHTPTVVAVSAPHIENVLALKLEMGLNPIPLEIRAPLRVDEGVENLERALPPGSESAEPSLQAPGLIRVQRSSACHRRSAEADFRGGNLWERLDGLSPFFEICVLVEPERLGQTVLQSRAPGRGSLARSQVVKKLLDP